MAPCSGVVTCLRNSIRVFDSFCTVLLLVFAAPRLISGPLHSGIARERAPTTVRAVWGTDGTSNAIHVSVDMESADKERLYAAVNMSSREVNMNIPTLMYVRMCV